MKPLGESALTVQFGTEISSFINKKVKALATKLHSESFSGFIECTPAFASVTVFFDPFIVKRTYGENEKSSFQIVRAILEQILETLVEEVESTPRIVDIPVCYGGDFGPDLDFVAAHNQLSADEVIHLHASAQYPVYMIGFAPGFPYLGGLSEKINAPRRPSPRTSIPAGSVGIAGSQTGVYPISTPGGWQLIGRTPMALFRPDRDQPSVLSAGDIVKFVPITKEEYDQYQERWQ
ncbi:5-oxoprolinase subunit PxpB [Domibacillus robiginosus]|uniref:5-oxoprolinase subunit PxpB n=1 Tax=Domibacillus robiginosus TaxID=1071054 RepID=UPI0009E3B540|nr:5-oxoprolinase subunit PxpB [Domibacillus robiginosus]